MPGLPRFGKRYAGGVQLAHEQEQQVIARIIELRESEGLSYSRIAGQLNSEGLLFRGKFWNVSTVRNIYRQETEGAAT